MFGEERKRLVDLNEIFPFSSPMYSEIEFYNEVCVRRKNTWSVIFAANSKSTCFLLDDDGREVCRIHLDIAQECDPGDSKEEQLGIVI